MRMMAKISMPVEEGNEGIKSGSLPKVLQQTAERWKPEAMYFTAVDGKRTGFIVFDLKDASDIPPFAEPFFMELNAAIELTPAMTMEDVQRGLSSL